jgi:hypothetical protein
VGTPLLSPSSAETINDGQFHTVELVTFDQMVNLSIDGGSPMTMDNFGKHYTLNSEAPLYVGGEDLPYIPCQASPLSCGDSIPRQGPPALCGQRLTRRAGVRAREMPKGKVVLLNGDFGRFCCLDWGLAVFWPA